MADEKEIQKAEKKVLSISLRIAKEKQRLASECFKILKVAASKQPPIRDWGHFCLSCEAA